MTTMTLPTPASGGELSRIVEKTDGDRTLFRCLQADDGWRPVAFYPAQGGVDVTVSVHRMPATFYLIDAPAAEVRLGTCSSGHEIAHDAARHLARGGRVSDLLARYDKDTLDYDS